MGWGGGGKGRQGNVKGGGEYTAARGQVLLMSSEFMHRYVYVFVYVCMCVCVCVSVFFLNAEIITFFFQEYI